MTKSFMRFSHNAETFYKFEKKKMFTKLEKNAFHMLNMQVKYIELQLKA